MQKKRHENFHRMKISQKLDLILPSFILCFPFHQRWSYFCKRHFKTKKQSKTKGASDYKKISVISVCQNQDLDYFHTSLLKALVSEIEGQVPQKTILSRYGAFQLKTSVNWMDLDRSVREYADKIPLLEKLTQTYQTVLQNHCTRVYWCAEISCSPGFYQLVACAGKGLSDTSRPNSRVT